MKESYKRYDHINKPIYEFISPNSTVLDIGSSAGALAGELTKSKNCTVDVIDYDAEAIKTAKKRGKSRSFFQIDLNNLKKLSIPARKYDYIVCADVLEHLLYPEKVVEFYLKYLKVGGKILISLPNIAFALYRLKLLLGRFDYEAVGVMDRTHLHFYTLSSMKKMFDRLNLKILTIKRYNNVRPRFFYLQVLKEIFPALFTIQFVFLLEREV